MLMELPDPLRLRTEFAEEARSERPGLARLCLLVGAVADPARGEPGIDAAEVELDRLAGELPYRPASPREWALALAELLGTRYGFHGTESDYRRLESSLLQEVLRRRRGLPILLSVVWAGGGPPRGCPGARGGAAGPLHGRLRPAGGPGARRPLRRRHAALPRRRLPHRHRRDGERRSTPLSCARPIRWR
ncbi:hypothetical protein Sgou_19160 [Streptomyces gougerotii]|uniref:Protein SirB1 N-terminal domain-containing protein n=1 Tax=Streptomyces gougerotii TaxID=53448 RepID=A0ABQ1D4B8_9ACTN|nr:hypothetical protein Sgou_19160 [Streptomyces gougerotii]